MPRLKNPKPQQCSCKLTDGPSAPDPPSISDLGDDLSGDVLHQTNDNGIEVSDHALYLPPGRMGGDYTGEDRNKPGSLENPSKAWHSQPDVPLTAESNKSMKCTQRDFLKSESFCEWKPPVKKARLSVGPLTPKLMRWVRNNFTMKKGSRTSAGQVIQLYEKHFEHVQSCVSLQNYQVGQLLRRLFPNIQRCKITLNGKRVWVYKDLHIVDRGPFEASEDDSRKDPISFLAEHSDENGINERQLSSFNTQQTSINGENAESCKKLARNSGILFNLLYPDRENKREVKQFETSTEIEMKKSRREDDVIQWLRDNYEYADGYFVKSMDVLKSYNRGQDTWVKYLSQVGRIVKCVFPKARHLRRSLKGGKREWVYHNIRPKVHTEANMWRGSTKRSHGDVMAERYLSGASMLSYQRYVLSKNHSISTNDFRRTARYPLRSEFETENRAVAMEEMLESGDDLSNAQHDIERSENSSPDDNGYLFNLERRKNSRFTANSTSSTRLVRNDVDVFYKTNRDEDNNDIPITAQTSREIEKRESDIVEFTAGISSFKSQIAGLMRENEEGEYNNDVNNSRCFERDKRNDRDLKLKEETSNEAEDLSMPCLRDNKNEITGRLKEERDGSSSLEEREELIEDSKKAGVRESYFDNNAISEDNKSRPLSVEHNYSFTRVIDEDFEAKDSSLNKADEKLDKAKFKTTERLHGGKMLGGILDGRRINSSPAEDRNKFLSWEDLARCGYPKYGWSLTPTPLNIPCTYAEWILFEGQLLRDGQRVFRELKIYDDWSVSIHVMGKKVNPNEVGGITDLQRTRNSVEKVFSTLSTAHICRGLPALCLSDLCAHGVVVARSEIWSSRENECEELRHRAINCQVLYRGNEEACIKCCRVVRVHSLNNCMTTPHNNGFIERGQRVATAFNGVY